VIKYINLYSYILLGEVFLTILFDRLPFPLYSYYFWQTGWFILLILFNRRVLTHRLMIFAYFGLAFFYIQYYLFDRPYDFFEYFLYIISALSVFLHVINQKNQHYLNSLSAFLIVLIVLGSITSLIGFQLFPDSIRFNPYRLDTEEAIFMTNYFASKGIMNYGFFYGLAISIPVLLLLLQKNSRIEKRILSYFCVLLLLYSIIKSNYATAFLLFLIGISIFIIGRNNILKYKYLFIVLIVIIIVSNEYVGDLFSFIASKLETETVLQDRINDLSLTIYGEEQTHVNQRLDRIPLLIENFFKSPIWGTGISRGHNFVLDILSCYGILGIVPYLLLFINFIKYNNRRMRRDIEFYFLSGLVLFIMYSFIKGAPGKEMYLFIFLIMPLVIYYFQNISYKINYRLQ